MKSVFDTMGETYRQCGDFLIPEIALPDTPENPLGKYGRMRQRYLKEHRRVLYNAMFWMEHSGTTFLKSIRPARTVWMCLPSA